MSALQVGMGGNLPEEAWLQGVLEEGMQGGWS